MTDKIPVKALYSGSVVIGLQEFESGDTIPNEYLGLGSPPASGIQNLFATFVADSGSVTAAGIAAQLIIKGGAGISTAIAGSPQTLTITADGVGSPIGAHNLNFHSDVVINAPTKGQSLVYQGSPTEWQNQTVSGGGGAFGNSFIFTAEHLDGEETTYEAEGHFIFPGSTDVGTPTLIKIIAWMKDTATGAIRLFDATNSLVIAEKTGITEEDPTIFDMGTISNIPTGEAIFEIQLKTSIFEEELRLYFLQMDF